MLYGIELILNRPVFNAILYNKNGGKNISYPILSRTLERVADIVKYSE